MSRFPDTWSKMNVVLCHDWLTGMRGGERVLELLCEGFPEAPIFTLFRKPGAISGAINDHRVWTSWLQGIPGITSSYRYLLPLFPSAIEMLDAPPADLLISTSHCVAKGLRPKPGTRHLCYCFTPMRYAWTFYEEYFGHSPAKALLARMILPGLRRWDVKSSNRVDRFAAISRHVQKRIKDFYGRESDVVYPPVAVDRWTPGQGPREGGFDLIVSALVPYKRLDLAMRAYTKLGRPLKVVGIGSETDSLRREAGPHIEFLGWRSDEEILALYRNARLLVFPGEEDFGIVPLEAQACGCPVVAYGRGGILETVQEGRTGVFFASQTAEALLAAVEQCTAVQWDPAVIRANAERFGPSTFISGLADSVERCLHPA